MTVLRNLALAGAAVLALGATACGDKTVTSQPASNTPTSIVAPGASDNGTATGSGTAAAASDDLSSAVVPDDTQLNDVDQMLRDIESDLNTADQEATTPEGDPTS